MSHIDNASLTIKAAVRQYLDNYYNDNARKKRQYDICNLSVEDLNNGQLKVYFRAVHVTVRSSDDRNFIELVLAKSGLLKQHVNAAEYFDGDNANQQ